MRVERKEVRNLDVGIYCLMLDCVERPGINCLITIDGNIGVVSNILHGAVDSINAASRGNVLDVIVQSQNSVIKFRNGSRIYFRRMQSTVDLEVLRGMEYYSALVLGDLFNEAVDEISRRFRQGRGREVAYMYQTYNY